MPTVIVSRRLSNNPIAPLTARKSVLCAHAGVDRGRGEWRGCEAGLT